MRADIELDIGRKTFGSGALADLTTVLRRSRPGDLVAVVGDNESIGRELERWCRYTGNSLLQSTVEMGRSRWVFRCGTIPVAAEDNRPVVLVAGGSGVVPLMAMLRHHAAIDHQGEMHLVYSARTHGDVLYGHELEKLESNRRAVTITLTRQSSPSWSGRQGRVDGELLAEAGWPADVEPRCYVCGPTPFVEAVADTLVAAGHVPLNIKTERFGPTGG